MIDVFKFEADVHCAGITQEREKERKRERKKERKKEREKERKREREKERDGDLFMYYHLFCYAAGFIRPSFSSISFLRFSLSLSFFPLFLFFLSFSYLKYSFHFYLSLLFSVFFFLSSFSLLFVLGLAPGGDWLAWGRSAILENGLRRAIGQAEPMNAIGR